MHTKTCFFEKTIFLVDDYYWRSPSLFWELADKIGGSRVWVFLGDFPKQKYEAKRRCVKPENKPTTDYPLDQPSQRIGRSSEPNGERRLDCARVELKPSTMRV